MKRSTIADNWLQQAKHDLDAARSLSRSGFWDTCALMCQQAAEKAVKAVWIDVKGIDAPRTHWVAQLASELGASVEVVKGLNVLIGDYAASRYPDSVAGVPFVLYSADDAEDRIQKAEEVLDWADTQWEDS